MLLIIILILLSVQLCWAHLKRDFQRLSERKESVIADFGKKLLSLESDLFSLWHEFKANKITRDELIRRTKNICRSIGKTLVQGSYTAPELKISTLL